MALALKNNWRSVAAGAAMSLAAFGAVSGPAQAQDTTNISHIDADIVISHGVNITSDVNEWVESLGRSGVVAVAVPDLDDADCAALIFDGEELYRFNRETVFGGKLAAVAQRLVEGERISPRTKSDCPAPVDVAALTLDS